MPSSKQLNEMRQVEIDKIDSNTLVDIKKIKIDSSLPIEQRMKHYLKQVKNPYCFKCGETIVKLKFAQEGKSLNQSLTDYFIAIKNR